MLFKNLRLFCVFSSNLRLLKINDVMRVETVLCRQHSIWLKTLGREKRKYSTIFLKKDLFNNCCQRTFASSPTDEQMENKWPKNRSWFERTFADDPYDKKFLMRSGLNLYEHCTDGVDFEEFLRKLKLTDSYFSWFRVTELHVWMCSVRAMAEGEEGKTVRNGILEALWKDASLRAKKFNVGTPGSRQKYMLELNGQFMASLFLYDEGLQSSDAVLASALWYRLLDRKCDDAEILANAVSYVRQQMLELEKSSRDDILLHGKVSFSKL